MLFSEIDLLVAADHVNGNLLVTSIQELGLSNAVWKQEPSKEREDYSWESLDDEQNSPWCKGAFDLGDAVCENTSIYVRLATLA